MCVVVIITGGGLLLPVAGLQKWMPVKLIWTMHVNRLPVTALIEAPAMSRIHIVSIFMGAFKFVSAIILNYLSCHIVSYSWFISISYRFTFTDDE